MKSPIAVIACILLMLTCRDTKASEPFMRAFLDRNYYTREQEAKVLVDFDLPQEKLKGVRIECRIPGMREKRITQVRAPTTKIPFPVNGLGVGEHEISVRLTKEGQNVGNPVTLTLKKLPPSKSEVKTDRERLCVLVDGKPFFPVGFVQHATKASMGKLEHLPGLGINLVMPFWRNMEGLRELGRGPYTEEALFNKLKMFLDTAHSLGLKVDSDIVGFYKYMGQNSGKNVQAAVRSWCQDPSQPVPDVLKAALERVRVWVNKVKDHPAIIAHKHFDEISDSLLPVGRAVTDVIHMADPYHPVDVLSESEHPESLAPVSDIMNADPCWSMGRDGGGLNTQRKVDRYSRAARRSRRPLWLVPAGKFKRNLHREMGPELRPHAYQCLIGGAAGIYWYNMCGPNHKASRRELCRLNEEMNVLAPILLEETPPQEIMQEEEEKYFRVLLKKHRGYLYLVCVNLIKNTLEVDIAIPQMTADSLVETLFRGSRIRSKGQGFHDTIEGYDTRVYKISAGTASAYGVKLCARKTGQRIDIRKWYANEQGAYFHPYYRHVVVSGKGNTLASITKDVNNPDTISYDPETGTCTLHGGLFICYQGELTIGDAKDPARGERLVHAERAAGTGGSLITVWGKLNSYNSQLEGFSSCYVLYALAPAATTGKLTARNSRFTGFTGISVIGADRSRADVKNCTFDHCPRYVIRSNLSPYVGWNIHDNEDVFFPGLAKYQKSSVFSFQDCRMQGNGAKARSYQGKDLVYLNTMDDAVGNKGFQPASLLVKWNVDFEVADKDGQAVPGVLVALASGCAEYNDSRITDKDGRCRLNAVQFFRRKDVDMIPVYEISATHKGEVHVLCPAWECVGNTKCKYSPGEETKIAQDEKSPYALAGKQVRKHKETGQDDTAANGLIWDAFDSGEPSGWRVGGWGGIDSGRMNCSFRATPAFRGPFCLGADNIRFDSELNTEKGRVEFTKYLVGDPQIDGSRDTQITYEKGVTVKLTYFVDGPSRPSWISMGVRAKTETAPVHATLVYKPGRYAKAAGVLTSGGWQQILFPVDECTARDKATGKSVGLPDGAQITQILLRFCWNWKYDYSPERMPQVNAVRIDDVRIVKE